MYDFIKERLAQLGKTQRELATVLKIDPPHLSAIFSGIRQIKAKEVAPLAEFLQFDKTAFVDFLAGTITEEELCQAKPPTKISPAEQEILNIIRKTKESDNEADSASATG